MKNSRFKLILCDLGNVVVNFDHRIAVRRIRPYTPRTFDEIYQIFFDSPLTRGFEEGRITPQDFFIRLSQELSLARLSFEEFTAIWNEIFFENRGIVDVLRLLKQHYPLRLVSNINPLHYSYIAGKFPQEISLFESVHLSYAVGHCKPHPEIYKQALRGTPARPQEVLYTDDRADLIAEAQKLGFETLLFKGVADFQEQLSSRKVL